MVKNYNFMCFDKNALNSKRYSLTFLSKDSTAFFQFDDILPLYDPLQQDYFLFVFVKFLYLFLQYVKSPQNYFFE